MVAPCVPEVSAHEDGEFRAGLFAFARAVGVRVEEDAEDGLGVLDAVGDQVAGARVRGVYFLLGVVEVYVHDGDCAGVGEGGEDVVAGERA